MAPALGSSRLKLLLDEIYDPRIAAQLRRRRGFDVRELGDLRGATDEAVFALATADGRALLTENVPDFVPLAVAAASAGRDHDGLILTSNGTFPRARPATAGAIVAALTTLARTGLDMTNQVVWLERA